MNYYGNLAYKADMEQIRKPQKSKISEKEKAQMIARKTTLSGILYIVVLAFSAIFMISKFVAVYDTGQEVASLTKQLEQKRSYTTQKIFEMEQSVDLTEVENIATTKLGMQRPEKHQIVYVNVKQNDKTDVTAKDVEGFGNRVSDWCSKLGRNIAEVFSIK